MNLIDLQHLQSPPPLERTEELPGVAWLEMFGNCESGECEELAVGRFYITTSGRWVNACQKHWNHALRCFELCAASGGKVHVEVEEGESDE